MLIGLYEEGAVRSPRPLYNGSTTACFHIAGKTPSCKECWNTTFKGLTMCADMALSNLIDIPSGLLLLLGEKNRASVTAASVLLRTRLSSV